jgi:hypothetical protein
MIHLPATLLLIGQAAYDVEAGRNIVRQIQVTPR